MKFRIMKNKNQFRQGDVLIERVDKLPKGKCAKDKGRAILAHGEATGHAHEVMEPKARLIKTEGAFQQPTDLEDSLPMSRLALGLGNPAEVKHQEHAPIPLKRGAYRVTRQREYSPEAIRNVAD